MYKLTKQNFFRCLSWLDEKAYHGGILFGIEDGSLAVWYPAPRGEWGEPTGRGPKTIDTVTSARGVKTDVWRKLLAFFGDIYDGRDSGKFLEIVEFLIWLEEKARSGGVFFGEVDGWLGVWCSVGIDTRPHVIGDNLLEVLLSAIEEDTSRIKKPCDFCDAPLDPNKETLVAHIESGEDVGFPIGYFLEVKCDGCGRVEVVAGW